MEKIVDNRMLEEHLQDDVLSEEGLYESHDVVKDCPMAYGNTKEKVDAMIKLTLDLWMNLEGI